MSGTRKMDKFELEDFTKARAEERQGRRDPRREEDGSVATTEETPLVAPSGSLRAESTGVTVSDLPPPAVDLPARPFEPVRTLESPQAPSDLPARPFEPRVAELEVADKLGPDADTPLAPEVTPAVAAVLAPPPSSPSGLPPAPPNVTAPMPVQPPPPPARPAAARAPNMTAPMATPATSAGAALKVPATPGEGWVPGEWIPPQTPEPPPEVAAKPGEADPDALRTRLARKFVTLADSVTEAFRDFSIGGGNWAVELTTPQGMSTGGGKQALQHLRLLPRRNGYSVLVAGTVNQVERRAELRDFDHVAITHEVRFRNALEISLPEWEQFLRRAEAVLNEAGIQSMRTPPPRDLLEQRRSMRRVSKGAVVALVVVLFLATIVAWRVVVALMSSS